MRTTKASMATPTANANPSDLMIGSGASRKPAKTDIMISAAAVTTRDPCRMPATTASSGPAPCAYASRMPVTRKTS